MEKAAAWCSRLYVKMVLSLSGILFLSNANKHYNYSGNIWQIAEVKVFGEKQFGEWIDFGHEDIPELKFGWFKSLVKHKQFAKLSHCHTFLLYSVSTE